MGNGFQVTIFKIDFLSLGLELKYKLKTNLHNKSHTFHNDADTAVNQLVYTCLATLHRSLGPEPLCPTWTPGSELGALCEYWEFGQSAILPYYHTVILALTAG